MSKKEKLNSFEMSKKEKLNNHYLYGNAVGLLFRLTQFLTINLILNTAWNLLRRTHAHVVLHITFNCVDRVVIN